MEVVSPKLKAIFGVLYSRILKQKSGGKKKRVGISLSLGARKSKLVRKNGDDPSTLPPLHHKPLLGILI